jgi:Protein of unknown function (DUF3606)
MRRLIGTSSTANEDARFAGRFLLGKRGRWTGANNEKFLIPDPAFCHSACMIDCNLQGAPGSSRLTARSGNGFAPGTVVASAPRRIGRRNFMATVIDRVSVRSSQAAPFYSAGRYSAPFNVSTREPAAIEYWCRHFNTSPERLVDAVRRVGSNPDIIRLALRNR